MAASIAESKPQLDLALALDCIDCLREWSYRWMWFPHQLGPNVDRRGSFFPFGSLLEHTPPLLRRLHTVWLQS